MLTGFYTIASGLLTRQRELDVLGSNLVNSQTPGYRASRLVTSAFEMELQSRQEAMAMGTFGVGKPEAIVEEVTPLTDTGVIKATDRDMDMAIDGPGYYTILGRDGQTYLTRNGQFNMDVDGYLVLPDFGYVMGKNGRILLETEKFDVREDGTLVDAWGTLDTLQIQVPAEGTELEKLDNGLFRAVNGGQLSEAEDYRVVQGSLELSNVDANQEMTLLMEVQRAFQNCSSAFQIIDSMDRKTSQIATI